MIPYINVPFDYLSGITGAATDELKLIFVFLLSYPLAGLLKRIPEDRPDLKNVFSICTSIFFLVGMFDLWAGLFTMAFDALGAYLIAAYVQGPYMPWIGFCFLMGHMSVSHLQRQFANKPTSVDISGAQMVMVMKLSAFCWNVADGKRKVSELSAAQKSGMLTKLPRPLDYAGFVAFFPSLMAGPAFDFGEYHKWLTLDMFSLPPGTDPFKAPPTRKRRRTPRSGTPAMMKMAQGLLWLLIFIRIGPYFSPAVILSKKYTDMNILLRVFYLYMMNLLARTKYYGVWSLTEGACILAGIGYKGLDPVTGRADWSRLTNIRPAGVEFAQNSHAYLGNWNINTNGWLKYYVYLRVTPAGNKPGFRASMATFVTSAFWHGFYPGYYMSFILASFIQNVAKNARRLLRPFFMTPDGTQPLPSKRYYDFFTWIVTQLAFCFTTTPFVLLNARDSLHVWAANYMYCIVGTAISSAFLASPGKAWLMHKVKARQSDKKDLHRSDSMESLQGATLGVPSEPGRELDEIVDEVLEEVKRRRYIAPGPKATELRKTIERKVLNHDRKEL
ncbi:MBOAT-domain-containing protein [Piedraia hortae CBS 480.64]|uniref:MBOAT-domain-containing protein n=1 Tax=Piedraia hortae CBS 480.64 TaxID=1314780 RepID=A0A6A7C598_9PEZI|nr:MBOAT-domain-containing protein [Piedraia hortae CBS 480.64]